MFTKDTNYPYYQSPYLKSIQNQNQKKLPTRKLKQLMKTVHKQTKLISPRGASMNPWAEPPNIQKTIAGLHILQRQSNRYIKHLQKQLLRRPTKKATKTFPHRAIPKKTLKPLVRTCTLKPRKEKPQIRASNRTVNLQRLNSVFEQIQKVPRNPPSQKQTGFSQISVYIGQLAECMKICRTQKSLKDLMEVKLGNGQIERTCQRESLKLLKETNAKEGNRRRFSSV